MTEPPPIGLPNGRTIGPGEPCWIVAEIGQNHNGDAYTALRLIQAAREACVDAVKLCKRDIPSELTKAAYDQPYEGPQSFGPTYGRHREVLEFDLSVYRHLKKRIAYNRWPQTLFATACDRVSVDQLEEAIDPPLYKVASRDLENLPLIDHVARLRKPMILSTGMACGYDIQDALEVIRRYHNQIVLLYCVSEYPADDGLIDLTVMRGFADRFQVHYGFSDHTVGIHLAQAAVAVGAVVIEKHVTLARAMKGTDHAGSLEPDGLRKLVRNIRGTEQALISRVIIGPKMSTCRARLGRSLVSRWRIGRGELITEEMLCLKSPGCGIPWRERDEVIGRIAKWNIPEDLTLQWSDFSR